MPRNPSTGIYTLPPGTGGTPNQPISSTMFNTFAGDVAQDLNGARPISAGGTGATNATQARANLGLGSAAIKNTGTSGDAVPLLNAANTWSGLQTFAASGDGATVMQFATERAWFIRQRGVGSGAHLSFENLSAKAVLFSSDETYAGPVIEIRPYTADPYISIAGNRVLHAASIIPLNRGGTGATTAAAARTALGLGSAATRDTGTSGATVPLLNGNNTWSGSAAFSTGASFGSGISFGSSTVSSGADVSRHIDLWGGSYGFSVTGSTLNHVSGGAHVFLGSGGAEMGRINSSGSMTLAGSLAVNSGGTGATTAAGARTNLGLAIGSDVQAFSSHLSAVASIAKTNGNFIVGNGTTWVSETPATARASMGLGGLATLDLADLLYTGSSASSQAYVIGDFVLARANGLNLDRNEAHTVYMTAGNIDFNLASGTALSGTWRARGAARDTNNDSYFLMVKVAN